MAYLQKKGPDITRKVDLAHVLIELFKYCALGYQKFSPGCESYKSSSMFSADQIWLFLNSEDSAFRRQFLLNNGFKTGELKLNPEELGRAINKLLQNKWLEMFFYIFESRIEIVFKMRKPKSNLSQ